MPRPSQNATAPHVHRRTPLLPAWFMGSSRRHRQRSGCTREHWRRRRFPAAAVFRLWARASGFSQSHGAGSAATLQPPAPDQVRPRPTITRPARVVSYVSEVIAIPPTPSRATPMTKSAEPRASRTFGSWLLSPDPSDQASFRLSDPQVTRLVTNADGRYSAFVDAGDAPDRCLHIRLNDRHASSLTKCRN